MHLDKSTWLSSYRVDQWYEINCRLLRRVKTIAKPELNSSMVDGEKEIDQKEI